ncbi:MAG: hypothetical protein IT237_12270 [Bacteroidia bacterium]|nr:hypothetical protein [Bacteroidia bacterium]
MENTCAKNEVKSDLFVRVKATKVPRYKAPAELGKLTRMISVEVSEEQTETADILDFNMHIQTVEGAKLTKADAGIEGKC